MICTETLMMLSGLIVMLAELLSVVRLVMFQAAGHRYRYWVSLLAMACIGLLLTDVALRVIYMPLADPAHALLAVIFAHLVFQHQGNLAKLLRI